MENLVQMRPHNYSSRSNSLTRSSSIETQDDAIYVLSHKSSSSALVTEGCSHSRRTSIGKAFKKRRGTSMKDADLDNLCVLKAITRYASENSQVKTEFSPSDADSGYFEAKIRKSNGSRHSYSLEPLNKVIESDNEQRHSAKTEENAEADRPVLVKQIRAGTLDRIVQCLVSDDEEMTINHLNANTFLATYRKYASGSVLLDAILRHCAEAAASLNTAQGERAVQAYSTVIHLWIELYPEDFLLSETTDADNKAPESLPSPSNSRIDSRRNSEDMRAPSRKTQQANNRRCSVDVRTVERKLTLPENSNSLDMASRSNRCGLSKTTLGSYASLNTVVRNEMLETFGRWERACKHEKFLKLLRKTRVWLSKAPDTAAARKMQPVKGPRGAKSGTKDRFSRLSTTDEEDSDPSLHSRLLNFKPRCVAETLTLTDAKLFRAVRLHQCLGCTWSKSLEFRARFASTVLHTIAQFNTVVALIQSSVLDDEHWGARLPQARAELLSFWIDVAHELRTIKNFSSLKATVTALTSNPIYRLGQLWTLVSSERREALLELETLVSEVSDPILCRELLQREGAAKQAVLTDADSTEAQLQHAHAQLACAQFGTIPYLGIFLTDLVRIDAALEDYVEVGLNFAEDEPVTRVKRRFINFEKCRREFEVLVLIRLLQSSTNLYLQNLKPEPQFETFYSQFRLSSNVSDTSTGNTWLLLLSEEECYKLSLRYEPSTTRSSSFASVNNGVHRNSSIKTQGDCSEELVDVLSSTPPNEPDTVATSTTTTTTTVCTPRIRPNIPLHRKTRSSDDKQYRLRVSSSFGTPVLPDRNDSEATTRVVKVKIDWDHPVASHSAHGLNRLTLPTMRKARKRTQFPHSTILETASCTDDAGFSSLRTQKDGKQFLHYRDLSHLASILNKFQSSSQFVDYKTIHVVNSDRKAHVIRKILAKFNLDQVREAHEYLDFCTSNFDLVQLLSNGDELVIGEQTNVFYALKSQGCENAVNATDDFVLALRLK